MVNKLEETLLLIWKDSKERRRYIIGILTHNNNEYVFKYVNPELEDAKKAGFDYFPGFSDTKETYINKNILFTNISTRLPNKNRPDYLQILNSYNLKIDSTDMEVLKNTKGRLLTDNFEFVPEFNKNKIEFDVAGTSHRKDIEKCKDILKVNDTLFLEKEPDNKYDNYAIKVIYEKNNKKYHIGYVPRYYSKELTKLLDKNIKYSAQVESLNFSTPLRDEDILASVKIIFNKQ